MAKGFELEGKIHLINDVQSFASGFSKREFVVEVMDGKFPQHIKFECVKEKTALLEGCRVGEPVKVFFDIRGNEYNGKYFVNLSCWKIQAANGATGNSRPAAAPSRAQGGPSPEPNPADLRNDEDFDDDVPF